MAHIGRDERCLGAEVSELGLQRLAFGFATARRDDACAIFGERHSGGSADAGQSTSDQDDWVVHSPVLAAWVQLSAS
jgi:hypothetical protein